MFCEHQPSASHFSRKPIWKPPPVFRKRLQLLLKAHENNVLLAYMGQNEQQVPSERKCRKRISFWILPWPYASCTRALEAQRKTNTGNISLPCHHHLGEAARRKKGKVTTWLQTEHRNPVIRQVNHPGLGFFSLSSSHWCLLDPSAPASSQIPAIPAATALPATSSDTTESYVLVYLHLLIFLVHTENVNKQDISSSSPDFLKALTAFMVVGKVQVTIIV